MQGGDVRPLHQRKRHLCRLRPRLTDLPGRPHRPSLPHGGQVSTPHCCPAGGAGCPQPAVQPPACRQPVLPLVRTRPRPRRAATPRPPPALDAPLHCPPSTRPDPARSRAPASRAFSAPCRTCYFTQAQLSAQQGGVHESGEHTHTHSSPATTLYALERTIEERKAAMQQPSGGPHRSPCRGMPRPRVCQQLRGREAPPAPVQQPFHPVCPRISLLRAPPLRTCCTCCTARNSWRGRRLPGRRPPPPPLAACWVETCHAWCAAAAEGKPSWTARLLSNPELLCKKVLARLRPAPRCAWQPCVRARGCWEQQRAQWQRRGARPPARPPARPGLTQGSSSRLPVGAPGPTRSRGRWRAAACPHRGGAGARGGGRAMPDPGGAGGQGAGGQ